MTDIQTQDIQRACVDWVAYFSKATYRAYSSIGLDDKDYDGLVVKSFNVC